MSFHSPASAFRGLLGVFAAATGRTLVGLVVDQNRKPGTFGPALVHKCAGTVRQRGESHRRNCFHNVPQTLFLTPELMNAPSMKCPEESKEGCEARQTEPVSLIVGRGDVQSDRSFWPVPQPLAVAGD